MTQVLENPHVPLNNARNLPRHIPPPTIPQPPPAFEITTKVVAPSEAAIIEFAIGFLRERGYYVADPQAPWEFNGAFCKRVGLFPHRIREMIERYERRNGPAIRVERRGKSGRIIALQSNPHFDNFCRSLCRDSREQS